MRPRFAVMLIAFAALAVPQAAAADVVPDWNRTMVDALLVSTTLTRRVRLTAKATLFANPLLARLLRLVGVVPLRRAKDELAVQPDGQPAVGRNTESFRQVNDALLGGSAVLVFPEGISHDAPTRTLNS